MDVIGTTLLILGICTLTILTLACAYTYLKEREVNELPEVSEIILLISFVLITLGYLLQNAG